MFNVNRSVTASRYQRNGLSLAEKRLLAHLVADKIVQCLTLKNVVFYSTFFRVRQLAVAICDFKSPPHFITLQ